MITADGGSNLGGGDRGLVVGIAQQSVPAEHQYRRSMQPSVNEQVGCVGVSGPLRGGAKADLAGKA